MNIIDTQLLKTVSGGRVRYNPANKTMTVTIDNNMPEVVGDFRLTNTNICSVTNPANCYAPFPGPIWIDFYKNGMQESTTGVAANSPTPTTYSIVFP